MPVDESVTFSVLGGHEPSPVSRDGTRPPPTWPPMMPPPSQEPCGPLSQPHLFLAWLLITKL